MPDNRDLTRPEAAPWRPPQVVLTEQFYAWERRGRGHTVWPYPVPLEPPFRPFFGHELPPVPVVDDGRRPSLFGRLAERLLRWRGDRPTAEPAPAAEPEDEELPDYYEDGEPLVELQLSLPAALKTGKDLFEQFLIGLAACAYPLSFEVIGESDATTIQLVLRAADAGPVRQQLAAYFPDVVVATEPSFLSSRWLPDPLAQAAIVEFGLAEEFMLPLRPVRSLDLDPLVGLVGALDDLAGGELGVVQILFTPARRPWAESIFRAVTDWDGKAFFEDAPELVGQAKEKIGRPLYAAVIRVAAQSPAGRRAWAIAQSLGCALAPQGLPGVNTLVPLSNEDYPEADHVADLLGRTTHRQGLLLNSDELVSLAHLPGPAVRSAKLRRETQKSKAAPELALGHLLVLGENVHNGQAVTVSLAPAQRLRHMHVIGASGTGKSTFLLNMILQDIEHGEGLAVLDPHGDLIDAVLARLPEARWDDVVLLDPSDEAYPVGFNILSAHSELEKHLLASDLASVFRRLSTNWGDQMNSVLGNAILAFLESERGGTLADLRRFLVERDFREEFLRTVRDREVVYYWQKEFPLLSGKPQGPLLTRLDIFLRPKLIRHMVAQRENKLDFARIMNGGQIFLAKLAQGAIGEENAYLLGTLLVSKFHQLALARQELAEVGRRDFFLYIDEFHNFVTPSMASILSGARKYHLGLILAHQEMRQISRESEVAGAVLANPYARVCFRLGDEDARKLADGFAYFDAQDLQNLGTGEAIGRLERADYDFNLQTYPLAPVDEVTAAERQARIIQCSRERYGTAREQVEAELERDRPASTGPVAPKAPVGATPQPELPGKPAVAAAELTPAAEPIAPLPVPELPAPPKAPPRIIANPLPAQPATPGRGGRTHKYLQQSIKLWAEGMGWRAEIEKQILDGAGSIDVALEKGSVTVACEISVTTGTDQELANIEKCLKAGYGYVVATASEAKQVEKIEAAYVKQGQAADNVRFLTVDELKAFVESLEAQAASQEKRIKGYKVKTKFKPVDDQQKEVKKQTLSEVFLNSLRKKNK